MPRKPKEWRCKDCSALLGIIADNNEYVRIKYKDLFIRVNGEIKIICRKCGAENEMVTRKLRF